MRQTEITRAIRAAGAAGLFVERIEVEEGKVTIWTYLPDANPQEKKQADNAARQEAIRISLKKSTQDLIELGKQRKRDKKQSSPHG